MKMRFPFFCLLLLAAPLARAELIPPLSPVAAAMEKFVLEEEIAGSVTLLAQNGEIIAVDAVGQQDIATKKAMARNSLFWIASMTKPITAMAIMMLQDEGKLKIEDPVSKHLPEFKNQMLIKEKTAEQTVLVKPKREITIKDLLTHTSGLVGKSPLDSDALDVLTLKEAVITYALSPLQFEPGSKWSYCNPGINTLGRIVEVVSGQPFARFLDTRLFRPLGMKDTTFWPTKKQLDERLATSYQATADGRSLEVTTIKYLTTPYYNQKRAPLAAGGLFSTADDLFTLYSMLLAGGEWKGKRLLSAQALKQMTTSQSGDLKAGFADGMAMGLGFQIVREPTGVTASLSPGTYGHGGAYGTQFWIDPKKKAIHILLIQRAGLKNSDASAMRQTLHETAASLLK